MPAYYTQEKNLFHLVVVGRLKPGIKILSHAGGTGSTIPDWSLATYKNKVSFSYFAFGNFHGGTVKIVTVVWTPFLDYYESLQVELDEEP